MSLYNKIIDLQNLRDSWKQVYKNRPHAGVDDVDCEAFEADKSNMIKILWKELTVHTYECMPVRLVPLFKGEKVRYISLYTMRDKVVQHSIARELGMIYENALSESCYSYRSGKSALQAAQHIQDKITAMEKGYVLRTDISSFFDCILHYRLKNILREKIYESDVLDLIFQIIKTPALDKEGKLTGKQVGIYQGATIAPILSNVYMMKFDSRVEQETIFYVRYSDDILIFFNRKEEAEDYRNRLPVYLEELGLEINDRKTEIVSFEEGFEYLGYRFSSKGLSIPQKAEDQLTERLEMLWLDSSGLSVTQKLEKSAEIIGGWEQYFSGNRQINSILEYAVWIYQMKKRRKLKLDAARKLRTCFENLYKDIAIFLSDIWRESNMLECELFEYEQYYGLQKYDTDVSYDFDMTFLQELLKVYREYIVQETEENQKELVQIYTDLKMYQKAGAVLDVLHGKTAAADIDKDSDHTGKTVGIKRSPIFEDRSQKNVEIVLSSSEIQKYMELFAGREDLYVIDTTDNGNKRRNVEVLSPLLPEIIEEHLEGKETVGTFVQRTNGTSKYLVIDLDISKSVFLRNPDKSVLESYMEKCFETARSILKELKHLGLTGYVEQSGCRGYHIWLFFTEWIPVRYINMLTDVIVQKTGHLWKDTDIQAEYFPNKTRIKNGKKGQCLKLPWGIHPKTQKRSFFLDEDGYCLEPQQMILENAERYSGSTIKKIIAANQSSSEIGGGAEIDEVDQDLKEFGEMGESVRIVTDSCSLIRYLCQKARKTHYLTHYERLTILYVYGHMGDEGIEFIHKIMAFTLNYSYQVTQKFIQRCPEKPVSCLKLREQYRHISAGISCSCNFHRTKNCYPSPVLHALKKSDDNSQITMPLSRSVPVNQQKVLKEEINAAVTVQGIAEKLMELRKQRRNLDKSIAKCEQELKKIFDENETDSMEIKMGLLIRRTAGGKTEWMVEL